MKSPYSNPQAVAEDKVLELFRNEGVFEAPKQKHFPNYIDTQQNINTKQLIHAVCKFIIDVRKDPRYVRKLLIDELNHWNI
jgi:hypothetical protein